MLRNGSGRSLRFGQRRDDMPRSRQSQLSVLIHEKLARYRLFGHAPAIRVTLFTQWQLLRLRLSDYSGDAFGG